MKQNYFKKTAIVAALLGGCLIGHTQERESVGAIYTTGGAFAGVNNYVRLGALGIQNGEASTLDSVLGNFSNFVAYDEGIIYWHAGRAADNPAGGDLLVTYSVITDSVDAVSGISGSKEILLTRDYAALLKGFGTDNNVYLELRDKSNLDLLVTQDTLTINNGGLSYDEENNILLVSYDMEDNGVVSYYDLNSMNITNEILFSDTGLIGMKHLFYDSANNWIVGSSKDAAYDSEFNLVVKSQRLFKYDLTKDSLFYVDVDNVPGSVDYSDGIMVGNFGAGISTFNFGTMSIEEVGITSRSYTAFEVDFVKQEIYGINTDYSSFGDVKRTSLLDDAVLDSVSVDISGTAIKVIAGFAPVAFDDSILVYKNGMVTFNPALNDTDADLPSSLTLDAEVEDENTPNGQIEFLEDGLYRYTPNQDFIGIDSAFYTVYDELDLSSEALIVFYVEDNVSVQELEQIAINVYPNPTKDVLNLVVPNNISGVITISNMQGQVIYSASVNTENVRINVAEFTTGFYLIELVGSKEVFTTSFEKI